MRPRQARDAPAGLELTSFGDKHDERSRQIVRAHRRAEVAIRMSRTEEPPAKELEILTTGYRCVDAPDIDDWTDAWHR